MACGFGNSIHKVMTKKLNFHEIKKHHIIWPNRYKLHLLKVSIYFPEEKSFLCMKKSVIQ